MFVIKFFSAISTPRCGGGQALAGVGAPSKAAFYTLNYNEKSPECKANF
jgi:hypothetical protein